MELRQLEYVVAVVDHGGFTAAAEALGVAQPSVSQGVRALEAELGVRLIARGARPVALTAAGEALVGPARRAMRDVASARDAVAAVAGVEAGHLDLVSLATLAVDPVAGFIGRFRRDRPGVTVRLAEPDDARAVAALVRAGAAEIGFAEVPVTEDELVTIELEPQDFVAVLPPGTEPGAGPLSARTLAELPLVTTPAGTSTRRQLDEALARAGADATIAAETDHREVLVPLVLAGAGASLLPRPVAAAAAEQGAVVRDLAPAVRRRIGVLHRPDVLSPAAEAFLALVSPGEPPRRRRPRARRRG